MSAMVVAGAMAGVLHRKAAISFLIQNTTILIAPPDKRSQGLLMKKEALLPLFY
jgi:hypothetical protein